jgi:hypothetical protein
VAALVQVEKPNLVCMAKAQGVDSQMTATDYDAEMLELDRWREAGKKVGRQLGVLQERRRVVALLEAMIADGDFVKSNGLKSLEKAILVVEGTF